MIFRAKVFEEKTEKVFELLDEALKTSHLEDEKRLKEIVSENASALYMRLISAGHSTAGPTRALSYGSRMGKYDRGDEWNFVLPLLKAVK